MLRVYFIFGAVILFALAGCSGFGAPGLTQPTYVAPTRLAIQVTPVGTVVGDAALGASLYREKQCVACHGPTAAGGMGGALGDTKLSFDQFLFKIRHAIPPKPAMSEADLSDADAYSIYLWVRTRPDTAQRASAAITPATLPKGQLLGIQVWNEKQCGECHGAFAQGSENGMRLAGDTFPFENQRAAMRASEQEIPAHGAENIPDDLLRRLLDWLRRGADPTSGC
jgi:mono/diheme cytochrome c family protein